MEMLLTSKRNIIVMLQSVDSFDLSTNVELLSSLVQVLDSWVFWVTTKDLLGLNLLVWLVDIVNGENGKVAIITEVAKSDSGSWCNTEFGDGLF